MESLDANLATRYTEYSTSGGINTWKVGLVYVPFEGLRVRGTISRDIRAANIQELFAPPSTGYANVRDPFRNNEFYATIPVPNGNANLQPEEADTKTLGIVYRPDFLPDFFISLDWYNIEIAGQIGGLAYQRTVDLCFQGQQEFCGLINRNSAGLIVTIGTPLLNIAQYDTSGVDPEMGYEQPLDLFGLAGDLSLRFFATHRIKDETATGGGACPQDSASNQGQEVASVTATYKTGPLSLSAQQNYVSGGRVNQTLPRFPGDRIKSQSFLDFTARYDFDTFELFGSVQNVLDRDPPRYPFTSPLQTSNGSFDQLGRRYVLGIRFDL
ncbi:MAG: TonB-dependent receptor [Hyphomonadaceae bacterium]